MQFDSTQGDAFLVTKADGSILVFMESNDGLYYMDIVEKESEETNGEVVLISTVNEHKARLTNNDYSQALLARKLMHTLGCPSLHTFIKIVKKQSTTKLPY